MITRTENNELRSGTALGDFKRTNVRLPRTVHAALKQASSERDSTIEEIVLEAVEKELGFGSATVVERSNSELKQLSQTIRDLRNTLDGFQGRIDQYVMAAPWEFARRFVETCPVPLVIKQLKKGSDEDKVEEVISFCNVAYAQLFQRSRAEVIGKSVAELNARLEKTALDVDRDATGGTTLFHERLISRGKEQWFTTHEFTFGSTGALYKGDVSFSFEDVSSTGDSTESKPLYYPSLVLGEAVDPESEIAEALLVAFLESIHTVALVKRPDGRIAWCNNAFLHLAKVSSRNDVLNRTSAELFSLPPSHPAIAFDREVALYGKRILGKHAIRDEERLVAHFPIMRQGRVEFIGLLSCTTEDIYRRMRHIQAFSRNVTKRSNKSMQAT